jgi:hypothetical protein
MPLTVLALNCTLKSSPAPSSIDKLLGQLLDAFREYDAEGEIVCLQTSISSQELNLAQLEQNW